VPNRAANRRPPRPGLWVGALTLIVFFCTTVFGSPSTVSETGPTGYLPADGFRVRFSGPTGAWASEWAVDKVMGFTNPGPRHFSVWLGGAGINLDATGVRLSTVYTNTSGKVVNREDDFMVLGADGVRTGVEVRTWTDARFYYPGRLDLSTQMAAGRSWVSEGKAWVLKAGGGEEKTTYRAEYSAATSATKEDQLRRCLLVTMKLRVGNVVDTPVTKTWCPGLGIVAVTDAGGEWLATNAAVTAEVAPEVGFDWTTAERLQFSPHSINDLSVKNAIQISVTSAPAILDDGTVVAVQRIWRDSVGLSTATEPMTASWRVRPGGLVTASGTLGGITLIANSKLQLIAYDATGRWLWQAPLPDQSVVAPVRLGNSAVVATLDGSLSAFDLATGTPRWSHRLSDSIRVELSASADRVVAVDQQGQLACFDANGVQQWSVEAGDSKSLIIVPGANPTVAVLAAGGSKFVTYSLTDGQQISHFRNAGRIESLIGLDGLVVARTVTAVVGVDPSSGAALWTRQTARTNAGIGGGSRLILATDDRLILLDERGQPLKEWLLESVKLGNQSLFLSTSAGRLLVWAPRKVYLGVTK